MSEERLRSPMLEGLLDDVAEAMQRYVSAAQRHGFGYRNAADDVFLLERLRDMAGAVVAPE